MTDPLPSALDRLDELRARMRDRRPLLFLDYDGTLTPIVDRPEDAVLTPQMRDAIERAARRLTVAIVSGRDLMDVRERVGVPTLDYAGSHGFDILTADGRRIEHDDAEQFVPELDAAELRLRASVTAPGTIVERKRFAIAVHFRLAPESAVPEIERAVDAEVAAARGLKKTGGKKIFELRPAVDWHKGKAVLWLVDALAGRGAATLPIYIGDDETDEDAFATLAGIGVGIRVGAPHEPTAALYRLDDVPQVALFLDRLAEMIAQ